ncbi:hypothetical protein XENOCAPTIV_018822, partial [Xenoophorus captivus]
DLKSKSSKSSSARTVVAIKAIKPDMGQWSHLSRFPQNFDNAHTLPISNHRGPQTSTKGPLPD